MNTVHGLILAATVHTPTIASGSVVIFLIGIIVGIIIGRKIG